MVRVIEKWNLNLNPDDLAPGCIVSPTHNTILLSNMGQMGSIWILILVYKLPVSLVTNFEMSLNPPEIIHKNFIHYLCVCIFLERRINSSDSQKGIC